MLISTLGVMQKHVIYPQKNKNSEVLNKILLYSCKRREGSSKKRKRKNDVLKSKSIGGKGGKRESNMIPSKIKQERIASKEYIEKSKKDIPHTCTSNQVT
jgi:hypothetical protein